VKPLKPLLFDAHNHLQHPALESSIAFLEAPESGVGAWVVNGTREADWESVAALARRFPRVIPSWGIHPWDADTASSEWESNLRARLASVGDRCGVGEIGLDRWKTRENFGLQKHLFRRQLAIGAERNLPVTIHCLRAWGALLEILEEEPRPDRGFLLHSYGGPPDWVGKLVGMGAYFSFSGYFLAPGKESRAETFRLVPPERLLIETDAPSMPPPPAWTRFPLPPGPEGERLNHPGNLAAIYEGAADRLGVPLEALTAQVARNFDTFFRG